jgi:hypothetical protein
VLIQLRSVVIDLLLLTGLNQVESTEALPPPPRWEQATDTASDAASPTDE